MIRKWATPLTIGAFIVMVVTGVLMFFHRDRGINAGVHEYVSWLFIIGAAGHVTANFKPFKNHMRSVWGRASVAVFVVITIASFFTWGIHTGGQLSSTIRADLVDTPLTTLAAIAHDDTATVQQRLAAHGVSARPDQSIRQLTDSREEQVGLLETVFLR